MKIILISPYSEIQSIGIRTLSACLKIEGYDVLLVFLPRNFMDRYEDKTLIEIVNISKGADLIGVSVMTNYFDNVIQLTQRLKKDLTIPILWGGIHATLRPAECLNYADMVCVGEGEEAVVELVRKMRDGQDYHDVQGIWFKDKNNIIKNKIRPLIQNLDSIPVQDYDYRDHYILDGKSICKMDEGLLKKCINGTYITMPSRGCSFRCSYCCNNTLNKMYPNQKLVRKRSVDNIIKELADAKSKLPFIKRIMFDDDAFFIYTIEEIREFCEKYKYNIKLPLLIYGATPLTLTREKLSLLVDAGLTLIRIGIQTGSERTKRLYNRTYSNQQVEKVVNIINDFKDRIGQVQYDIILDNPWETDEDLIETLMFLSKLPTPYVLNLFSLTFFPETELYRIAKRDGLLTNDSKDVYHKCYSICKKTYLNRLFFLINDYVTRGWKISPKMMSLLTSRKLKQLKLNWLLYIMLKTISIPWSVPYMVQRFYILLQKGLKDILAGDWFRIIRYIKRHKKQFEMQK